MLARRSEVWMVMVSCIACEEKDTFVVKFPQETRGRRRVTSYRLSKPPSAPLREGLQRDLEVPPTPFPSRPVSVDDVLDMHQFLKDFDGDFQRLFSEIE